MTLKNTKVTLTDAVYINLKGHRKVKSGESGMPRFETAQDELLRKFLKWTCDHPEIEIHLQSSGLGSCTGWAPADSRYDIEEFFRNEGVRF